MGNLNYDEVKDIFYNIQDEINKLYRKLKNEGHAPHFTTYLISLHSQLTNMFAVLSDEWGEE